MASEAKVVLRTRLGSPSLDWGGDDRLILINDVRRPVGPDLTDRYGLEDGDIHDLYSFIDENKEQLVRGYLDAVDRFYFAFRRLVPSDRYSDNILLYHFSSKRTDVSASFKNFCVTALRDRLSAQFPGQQMSLEMDASGAANGFSLVGRLRLVLLAVSFFLKILLLRVALVPRRAVNSIEDYESVFYTQFPRQRGPEFDNVNYGKVFNALSPDVTCVYLLSALTDGVHDGPGWRELLRRSRTETASKRPIWLMERAIDLRLIFKTALLLMAYIRVVLALSEKKISRLPAEDLFVFQDELRPTVRRMFNYAYVSELSKKLAGVIRNKVFVYYLFEHNYGKLLSFHLHERNVTLGCQHGTMIHLRLGQYLTKEELRATRFPTYVIAEGWNHERSLRWIHPDIAVKVLGAPRVEHLAQAGAKATADAAGEVGGPGKETAVLVPMSLHGDLEILDYVVDGVKAARDVHFYIKPHPARGEQQRAGVLEHMKGADMTGARGSYSIHDDSVYDLMGRVQYVMFADTSVGIEFAEAGAVPICVEPADRLNLSPLVDIDLFHPESSFRSHFISHPSQLAKLISGDTPDTVPAIPEGFYFAHLGSATERWAEFIRSQVALISGGIKTQAGGDMPAAGGLGLMEERP